MKTKTLFIIFCLAVTSVLQAQEKQHLAESKSLIGIWRQIGMTKNNAGEVVSVKSPTYKVVNPDGTFYAFITWGAYSNVQSDETTINLYGTYTFTSDSTFTEHIIKHSGNPKMDNTESELKYKFVPGSNNNAVYMMWKNTVSSTWIPEIWERVVFPPRKRESQTL